VTVAALLLFVTGGSKATMHLKVPPIVGTSDNTIYIDDSYIQNEYFGTLYVGSKNEKM
jgi:hypothetical protein